ncbi:type 1 glutamine amidotransferase [Qingshengfaniella alkalisoli]|uniref:Type 1 glutamine amidotransferase n=1 Tax=Qingshengfaniella alkalisoli TaxID=2599296 RepID=A0A5B8JBA8_9RHOB|nr:type 1 glutamine amidotransferase [Qingshengfaniella alkalisoli]QDY71567.1 type 1 glutamine amidotransferase [Qingshengfaniella alkalisoli]
MTTSLRIGVLETGRPPEELAADHGDYPSMVADWLAPLEGEVTQYAVLDGKFPESPDDADLWIITGSKFGVYENHPFIAPLEDFIRRARDAGRKMVGICFGHQVMAQALGGAVGKSDKGWGLGVHEYTPVNWPDELGTAPEKLSLQAYHQDQVKTLPEGARVIASSEFCDYAALWYPGFGLSVQGHPEFRSEYASQLLNSRKGTLLAPDEVDDAQSTMAKPTTQHQLAELIRIHFPDL